MECCEPKLIPVESPDGLITFSFQRCGKCYACTCGKRGEMVYRMKSEMEDKYNVSKYFITLTYDDRHLPTLFNDKEWQAISWYYHNQPEAFRRYDYSILEPWLLSSFIVRLSNDFNVTFCNGYYDKHKNCIRTEENTHLRYFCTGEFGDISHRSHYHGCFMLPRDVSHMDFVNLVRRNWVDDDDKPIGCTNIQPIETVGACNYVAKHQVKECVGSEFQQFVSPIFAKYSIYGGGLGRILKNDDVMRRRYFRFLKTRDRDHLYYTVTQDHTEYKIAIPRFLIKTWHPEKFSTGELVVSQNDGLKNLMHFVFCNLTENMYLSDEFRDAMEFLDWQFVNFRESRMYDLDKARYYADYERIDAINVLLSHVTPPLKDADKQRKVVYMNKHISAKLDVLARGDLDDSIIY